MASWRDLPMLGFDLETDSPNPEDAHIVTACAGLASPYGWQPHNWLLTQDQPIPDEATAIHGITTEFANEHGVAPAEALPGIVKALNYVWDRGGPVVGHNTIYDLTVLDRNLRRHGLAPLDVRGPVIDTLCLDKAVDKYRKGSRRLIDTAAHYGFTLTEEEAHGAEADARVACRIAWRLAALLPGLDLAAIHHLQVEAYAEQRLSFAAYMAKKGEPVDDTNTAWPLKPYPLPTTAVA